MNRRNFIASLLATAVLDPERLLWVKTKTIFIPKPAGLAFHKDAFAMAMIDLQPRYYVAQIRFTEKELQEIQRDWNAANSAHMDAIRYQLGPLPPEDSPFAS